MQFALDAVGSRIEPSKGGRGVCAICGGELIAKCGRIVVHHWAHAVADCDCWYEPETAWHRGWKSLAPADRVEVVMGEHRADVVSRAGWVLELQNSAISPADIQEREAYYQNMRWLVNAEPFLDRLFLLEQYPGTNKFKFKWNQMRTIWRFASRPVYLHLHNSAVANLLAGWEFRPYPGKEKATKQLGRCEERAANPGPHGGETILLVNTLHESGWGSVSVVPFETFTSWIR